MDRSLQEKRVKDKHLLLEQNEPFAILDEKTGELRNVGYLGTDSSNCSLDFSPSESDFVCVDASDGSFPESQDNMSCDEIPDPTTGLLSVTKDGDGRAKKRSSAGQSDKSQWKRQKNAQARLKGEPYLDFKKDERGKYVQIACKPAKGLREHCGGHVREKKRGGPRQRFTCK